jgi:hypothetical protein
MTQRKAGMTKEFLTRQFCPLNFCAVGLARKDITGAMSSTSRLFRAREFRDHVHHVQRGTVLAVMPLSPMRGTFGDGLDDGVSARAVRSLVSSAHRKMENGTRVTGLFVDVREEHPCKTCAPGCRSRHSLWHKLHLRRKSGPVVLTDGSDRRVADHARRYHYHDVVLVNFKLSRIQKWEAATDDATSTQPQRATHVIRPTCEVRSKPL